MIRLLFPGFPAGRFGLGLLVLRLAVGAAYLFHGRSKIQNPFGWMGPKSSVPGVFQMLAAISEFGGGISLILGFLVPLFASGMACTMIVALAMVHIPHGDPFVGQPGQHSAELAVVYLACSILFLLQGPGLYSLDALLFRRWVRAEVEGQIASAPVA